MTLESQTLKSSSAAGHPRAVGTLEPEREAALRRVDHVSFDVFDTLLERPVLRPPDVFELTRRRVNAGGKYWLDERWTENRVEAEKVCYADPAIGPDVTIDDVYAMVAKLHGYSADMIAELRAAELATERAALRVSPAGARLYHRAQELGKPVHILSDMYLPPDFIVEVLRGAGFDGWQTLIVSGYDKIAKHSGSAYRRLRRIVGPDAAVLHVGDNEHSDIDMAKAVGFSALHLPHPKPEPVEAHGNGVRLDILSELRTVPKYVPAELSDSLVLGLVANWTREHPKAEIASGIGYSVLGPLLAGFSQWLDRTARNNGVNRLLFLAREGRILQDAYRILHPQEPLDNEYVYASRRMFRLLSAADGLQGDQMEFLTSTGAAIPLRSYITRFVDLPEERLVAAAATTGMSLDTVVPPEDRHVVRDLIRALESELLAAAQQERADVLAYLEHIGADRADTGVVDIGWQGSIQRAIRGLVNPGLQGFYLGVHDTPAAAKAGFMHGFLDARTPIGKVIAGHTIAPGIEVIEILFGNPDDASTRTVTRDSDGLFQPVWNAERMRPAEAAIVRQIQSAALCFVRDFAQAVNDLDSARIYLGERASVLMLHQLIANPTVGQVALLGGINHDNSLGVRSSALARPLHPPKYYEVNPDDYNTELDMSWWKKGFEVAAAFDLRG